MKVMFFGLILLVTAFSSVSQEIQSNGFSLTLGNGWSVVNTNKITTVAANEESEQVIILSVYIVPSVEKGAEILAEMKSYLSNLNEQLPKMELYSQLAPLDVQTSAPWELVAYSGTNEEGHLVAACLGTNKGVLMVSLEGMGSVQSAIPQLKSVLSSLNHNET